MTEQSTEPKAVQKSSGGVSDNAVSIVAIAAVMIVMMSCIVACTLLGYMFFANPPW